VSLGFAPHKKTILTAGGGRVQSCRETLIPEAPIPMTTVCKHPKVRVVAREEDAEYVECQDCGEVFDSTEFHDIAIEEDPGSEPEEEKP
jgi:hypothetical protein